MSIEERNISRESSSKEDLAVRIADPMLYDRLLNLSAEYSVSVELLVNAAVKRLIDDVDFIRNLRIGKTGLG